MKNSVRQEILDRDGPVCQECGVEVGPESDESTCDAEVHHKTRRRNGGEDSPENLITLCHECHIDEHHEEKAERASGPRSGYRGSNDPAESESRSVDEMIVELLQEGRVTAPFAADETGYSLQYVRERLDRLVEHGNAYKVYEGLYELVEDPRENGAA